jgi:hypothetical protein
LPVPPAPGWTINQASLLVAVQLQPLVTVTLTLPSPPSDAKETVPGEIVGDGFITVFIAVAELLPETESLMIEVAAAVLLMTVASGTEQLATASIVITADAPGAIELNDTTRLLPDPPHTPPPVDEQDTKEVFAGRLSVIVTETAASGPLFVTVIV